MTVVIPTQVELCIAGREGLPCLGVIHRRGPEEAPYCYRCGREEPGRVYALVAPAAAGEATG